MIFVAALAIIVTSVERFLHPQPLENAASAVDLVGASAINGGVAFVLLRAPPVQVADVKADGKHLMTDVWTSAASLWAAPGPT